MNLKLNQVFYLIILSSIFASACLDDFNRENDPVYYTPSFSIPIGPLKYTLEDIMPPESLDIPILDTSAIDDSIPLILYDDSLFFVNPTTGYDTSFTGEMDLTAISPNMQYAQSLMFRMNYSNEIPTDLAVQMYFFNGNQIVDSLFENGRIWIAYATQTEDERITIPVTGREEVYVDSSRIEDFLQINNYALSIHVQTYREGLNRIHVYSYSGFDMQLALRAELLVPFE
jgi:hypothetical protein